MELVPDNLGIQFPLVFIASERVHLTRIQAAYVSQQAADTVAILFYWPQRGGYAPPFHQIVRQMFDIYSAADFYDGSPYPTSAMMRSLFVDAKSQSDTIG